MTQSDLERAERRHYPGELLKFFRDIRGAAKCESMEDDCLLVAQEVAKRLQRLEELTAALGVRAEPPPASGEGDVWAELITFVEQDPAGSPYRPLLPAMKVRREQGILRYGVPLCRQNGRSHAIDEGQELLDAAVYHCAQHGARTSCALLGMAADALSIRLDVAEASAWGCPTSPLTADEWRQLFALGCGLGIERVPSLDTIADLEETTGDPAPVGTWKVWRAWDGAFLGPDVPESRGYLRWLIAHRIRPESRAPGEAASIGLGRNYDGQPAWWGWSHRGCAAFGVGDRLFCEEELAGREDVPWAQVGSQPIETMEQARQAAINLAEYLS